MTDPKTVIRLIVNGKPAEVAVDPGKPLVDVIRDDLHQKGAHVGCRNGDCGACTVLIDGAAYKSCLVPCHRAASSTIETLEGLATNEELHPVQRIFWELNAFQCGFCLSGHILCTVALLRRNPEATLDDIEEALAGNLCRCTGYQNILAAAARAADYFRSLAEYKSDKPAPVDANTR